MEKKMKLLVWLLFIASLVLLFLNGDAMYYNTGFTPRVFMYFLGTIFTIVAADIVRIKISKNLRHKKEDFP